MMDIYQLNLLFVVSVIFYSIMELYANGFRSNQEVDFVEEWESEVDEEVDEGGEMAA